MTDVEKKGEKLGQIQISFGMIFSIILIIAFVAFAFFGIRAFLGIQSTVETAKFLNDFRSDVEEVWKSSQTSQEKTYLLPEKISYVCIVDFEASAKGSKRGIYSELRRAYYGSENLVFYPLNFDETESVEMKYIDLTKITEEENPFCIENINGKVRLRLVKDFDDDLVTITRV